MTDVIQDPAELQKAIPEAQWPRALKGGHLKGPRMGQRVVARGLHQAGFRDLDLVTAAAVCGSESWLYRDAYNDNVAPVGTLSVYAFVWDADGLWQIASRTSNEVSLHGTGGKKQVPVNHPVVTSRDVGLMEINISPQQIGTDYEKELFDPATNFAAAKRLFDSRGFQPWVGFTSGTYLHDTYVAWALLGTLNFYGELQRGEGSHSKLRVPFVSLNDLRKLYPDVVLG